MSGSGPIIGAPNLALIDAITQFVGGTQTVWNTITIPIPAGLVVYATDTTALKIGDGSTLYVNLPVVIYLNAIVSMTQVAALTTQVAILTANLANYETIDALNATLTHYALTPTPTPTPTTTSTSTPTPTPTSTSTTTPTPTATSTSTPTPTPTATPTPTPTSTDTPTPTPTPTDTPFYFEPGGSCFLAGSPVKMGDGSFKPIETVLPGDTVVGAFGELNTIRGLDFVVLGDRNMYNINNEHDTSDDHPHISPDRKFYSPEVDAIYKEWGHDFPVILQDGSIEMWTNTGLSKGMINTLTQGIVLQTLNGPKMVETFTQYRMPPETKLYNLVVAGSHTYTVNGYAVTGWPTEVDFDYSTWTKKEV